MRSVLCILIFAVFAVSAAAQSGRVKPAETPKAGMAPSGPGSIRSAPTPRPTPTPRSRIAEEPAADEGDIIVVESRLVPIPVSVLDVNGRSISGLRAEDFELLIDGKPAEITEIFTSDTPVRLALLFDNSSSVVIAREFEKDAAIRFFRRVIRPEKDLAALYSVSTTTRLEQGFTKDISALVRAIETFPAPVGATALLGGIVHAANYLEDVQGRRVVVIVSDGDDTASDVTFEQAVKALQYANCQVYVVKTTDFENFVRTKSRTGNANIRQLMAERRMLDMAAQTGGSVYSPIDQKEMDAAFRQIASELSQQYILSYYPDDKPEDRGVFREITLRLKTGNDADVRTRKGYYVPRR